MYMGLRTAKLWIHVIIYDVITGLEYSFRIPVLVYCGIRCDGFLLLTFEALLIAGRAAFDRGLVAFQDNINL